jgi:hypothetical protein
LHQGVFRPLVYVGFHQKTCLKKVWMVLEKRKNFMQKSGTKNSLFRLRLSLFHAMLDVVLIVCLVVFCCRITCLKWLRLLNEPLKKIMCCFYYMEAFILFSPWCFIWVDLAHAYNMFDSYKVAISLYDHLIFDLWCYFMLLLLMFCRYALLWPLVLS